MLRTLRNFLLDPRVRTVDVDSPHLISVHRTILTEKRCMREVFSEFYALCRSLDQKYFSAPGLMVELGAGSSFFKKQFPEIVSTDIKPSENLDMVVDALQMPFKSGEVRALYGLNCFHHFPDPRRFFVEATRVLSPGGGIVFIEPYFGFLAKWFYARVFESEHFNMDQSDWKTDSASGPMNGANQALSYIVFRRDLAKFTQEFPDLELVCAKPLTNYPRYFLSGGLNFRQLVPDWMVPLIRAAEWVASPLSRWLALHHVVVLRKRSRNDSL